MEEVPLGLTRRILMGVLDEPVTEGSEEVILVELKGETTR